ncbi:MAG: hypothetical protein ACI4AA_00700 [Lachnospiraceae bacterium]
MGLNKNERKKYIEEISGKSWIKKVKNKQILRLIKVMIKYTERGDKKGDALRKFHNLKSKILRVC